MAMTFAAGDFRAKNGFGSTTPILSCSPACAGGKRLALAANLIHKVIRLARGPRNAESVVHRQSELDRPLERNSMPLRYVYQFNRAGHANRGTDLFARARVDQRRRTSGSPGRFF